MDRSFLKKFLVLTASILLFSFILSYQPVHADCYADAQHTCMLNDHWLLGFGVGSVERKNLNSSTSVDNGSPIPYPYYLDTYTIGKPSNNALIALFVGYQWNTLNIVFPYYSLKLRYEHQFNSTLHGTIEQYGLPEFLNYNYSVKLNSSILDLVGKINLIQYKCILPYLSAGIGLALNRLSNYTEQSIYPVDPARISPDYASETNINVAYSLGAGFDFIWCKNLWLTIGYEYLNLGTVNSAQGARSWSNAQLDFGTLKTNTLFGSITYLF